MKYRNWGKQATLSFGKEHAKGKQGDLKEFWHFGQYVEDNDALAAEYHDNVAVTELPVFNTVARVAAIRKNGAICACFGLTSRFRKTYFDGYI